MLGSRLGKRLCSFDMGRINDWTWRHPDIKPGSGYRRQFRQLDGFCLAGLRVLLPRLANDNTLTLPWRKGLLRLDGKGERGDALLLAGRTPVKSRVLKTFINALQDRRATDGGNDLATATNLVAWIGYTCLDAIDKETVLPDMEQELRFRKAGRTN